MMIIKVVRCEVSKYTMRFATENHAKTLSTGLHKPPCRP